jgi:hypothetical protein
MSSRALVVRVSLLIVTVLSATEVSAATAICPPPNPPITDSDDRRRKEEDFDAKGFAEALTYFEEDLPRELREKSSTEAVRQTESFMIGYPNVVMAIRGYVLRQEALLRMTERDLAVERSQRGRASKREVTAASARFQEARQRFCDFLKKAFYAD